LNNTELIIKLFKQNADKETALPMKKYMKDNFEFLGIKSPQRSVILKEFLNHNKELSKEELIKIVEDLWNEEAREFQYVAIDLLLKKKKMLDVDDLQLLERLVITKSWWDTVDALSSNLIGYILKDDTNAINTYINKWVESDNMWLNRTAILFQLKYKSDTDEKLLYEVINRFSSSNEFFIQKSIGWSLREYSKTNPSSVIEFINNNELKPLSRREGLKQINKA
jgi:3-methyladenine DNA glycosylase AlkD